MDTFLEAVYDFFRSEAAVPVVMTIIGAIIGLVRMVKGVKGSKINKALEALEIGIKNTYEGYVRDIKKSREDGKLTDKERRKARAKAIEIATNAAKEEGIDLVKTLGEKYIPVLIEKIISKLKGNG